LDWYERRARSIELWASKSMATIEPASDRAKSYNMRSLRGANERIAYMFMDFCSNNWSMAGRFMQKGLSRKAAKENPRNAAALCVFA